MEKNMILSASGWRKVFAISGDEQDKTALIGETNTALSVFSAVVFADYVKEKTNKNSPRIVVGMDARPTGSAISEAVIKTLIVKDIEVSFLGITAAPEIMAYARKKDGFLYISASHNPVGHNGIKFGLNSGGVLEGSENAILVKRFEKLCDEEKAKENAFLIMKKATEKQIAEVYKNKQNEKEKALDSYNSFLFNTITGLEKPCAQEKIFNLLKEKLKEKHLGIVCDMNGSARCESVDKKFISEKGMSFYAINDVATRIVHEIIPEAENLNFVAEEMNRLQKSGKKDAIIGYMPDCDGDRGNIVYWDEKQNKSVILKAQEVFSLSVLSELCWTEYLYENNFVKEKKQNAVAVNCPTSMRIEEIAKKFDAKVFRAEVGEANVVNLALKKRNEGFNVRIFGEGSNGGTITYPSAVRDPLNTIFAIVKLLVMPELFKSWCKKNNIQFNKDFTLTDILQTLPVYVTTGVSDKRALLSIKQKDHAILKKKFQVLFESSFEEKKQELKEKFGICYWKSALTNGTEERLDVKDFSESKKGGLKIIFFTEEENPLAFMWMRGSGTEPVFRIMCDVKGNNPALESYLIEWETELLKKADSE